MSIATDDRRTSLEGTVHFICELQRPGKRKRADNQAPQIAGWSFRCSHGVEYLLSFPTRYNREVIRAVKQTLVVRLSVFTLIPLFTMTRWIQLIEVHEDGLFVPYTKQTIETRIDREKDWTLAQISLKEALDRKLQQQIQGYRPYKDSQSRKYSFRATIQAITPILTLDPSDPFCLMQVEEEGYSSVLVLQKEALACCTLLAPGETCYFQDVTRIAWKVSEEMKQERFAHLKPHVPTHVFVVHSIRQIEVTNSPELLESPQAITGCIAQVHRMAMEHSAQGNAFIQYVDLVTHNNTTKNCRLYLEHFPMSSTTQMSLRKGATIMATNLHDLGQGQFATCLRSNLQIQKMQPEGLFLDSQKLDLDSTIAFAYARIRKSCYETALTSLFSEFIDGFDIHDKPSIRYWTRSWLGNKGVACRATNAPKRNVYAEFFDHGDVADADESTDRCGCSLSRCQETAPKLPFLVGLSDIQNEALRVLQARLSQYIASNSVRAGWTASFSLVSEELNDRLNARKCSSANTYSGGVVVSATGPFQVDDSTSLLLAVSNGHTVLPIAVESDANISLHGHVLFHVQSVTTSVLCLGKFPTRGENGSSGDGADVCILPMFGGNSRFRGPCALVRLAKENLIFIVSFYIQANSLLRVFPSKSIEREANEVGQSDVPVPLASVALPTFDASVHAPDSKCIGLLARKQFAFLRLKNGSYGGVALVFAHKPSRKGVNDALADPSVRGCASMQSIDFRPSLALDEDAKRQMEAFFSCSNISASGVLGEQVATALAFWKIASFETHCSLLSGGLDELTSDARSDSHYRNVAVLLPLNSFQRDPKRGYLRVRCTFNDVVAFPVTLAKGTAKSTNPNGSFDFVGGGKMISGMLSRRRYRKRFGDVAIGELTSTLLAHVDGVPTCSIGEMHRNVCRDVKNSTCIHAAPSLTRKVIGGTFLGVSFCRAIAECSECYSPLVKDKHKMKQSTASVARSKTHSSEKFSFWNSPLPPSSSATESTNSEAQTDEKTSESNIAQVRSTDKLNDLRNTMTCPKRCGGLTAIKWECSGTLDDSTGQAKLYAERDAALLLLGMNKTFMSMIEEGAWLQPNGIVFSKAMAPNPSITYAVSRAKYRAAELRRGSKISESDVLKHMEPCARADYLLQRHCRFSPEPSRDLIYYVLCKPMGDNSLHLKHTIVDLVSGQSVPTYTLPPLKLVLVDCHAVSSRGRQYDDSKEQ